MTRPRILVLGAASAAHHGRDQICRISLQARRRGIHLIGADTPENLRQASAGLFDEFVELPVYDTSACRSWAATRPKIDAALSFREMCVEPVAAISEELGVAGNDPAAARIIRHKDLARERLKEIGLRQPRTLLTASPQDAVEFMGRARPGPWIVKPRAGVGSEGVSLVKDADDLPQALEGLEPGIPFLIEDFVYGREYSAEGICLGGTPAVLAFTEKFRTARFVSTGHRIPAGLNGTTGLEAGAAVKRALTAIGITRGIFHVEFWVTSNGIVLGELHARPGGDFIHALTEHSRPGLELYGTLMDDLLNNGACTLPGRKAAAGVEYLFLPQGRVRSVDGWAAIPADESVIAAHLDVRCGDQVRPVHSYADRHGVIAVTAPTRGDVEAELTRLMQAFHVDIEHKSTHGKEPGDLGHT
jgi:hypothetical protein